MFIAYLDFEWSSVFSFWWACRGWRRPSPSWSTAISLTGFSSMSSISWLASSSSSSLSASPKCGNCSNCECPPFLRRRLADEFFHALHLRPKVMVLFFQLLIRGPRRDAATGNTKDNWPRKLISFRNLLDTLKSFIFLISLYLFLL